MVIAAYNEEQAIAGKLDNSLALDYPPTCSRSSVASDGSKDRTNQIVRTRVRAIGCGYAARCPRRQDGGQNHAADVARGEILVFSDATTMYDPQAVRAMVANYADPVVGSVGGDVRYCRGRRASDKGRAVLELRGLDPALGEHLHGDRRDRLHLLDAQEPLHPPRSRRDQRLRAGRGAHQRLPLVVEDDATCYEVAESSRWATSSAAARAS